MIFLVGALSCKDTPRQRENTNVDLKKRNIFNPKNLKNKENKIMYDDEMSIKKKILNTKWRNVFNLVCIENSATDSVVFFRF